MDVDKLEFLQTSLLSWFSQHGRKFHWRNADASNYEVIIAEILLQRTKAGTVAKYLPVFLAQYPSWVSITHATEKELQFALRPFGLHQLKARRLHQLGQEIEKLKGELPETKDMVSELSLFGQYTANAFELFILKKPAALLDVNMARLLERFFEPRQVKDYRFDKGLNKLAGEVVLHTHAKELNWAILDYASLICTGKRPKCDICILAEKCNFWKTTN